jgi:archaellum component FlaC
MHDDRALLRIYKLRYLVCLDNPKLIKMFFGIFDTIETIHLKIETLENNIKNNYLYL